MLSPAFAYILINKRLYGIETKMCVLSHGSAVAIIMKDSLQLLLLRNVVILPLIFWVIWRAPADILSEKYLL